MAITIIDRALNWVGLERRATSNSPHDPIYGSLFGNMPSKSGVTVTADSALKCSAVLACVRVLAETVASLPLVVYKRTKDGGKEVATDHYLYKLLHDSPNQYMTSYDLREMMMGHLNLRGNFYAYKEINNAGEIANLVPLNPAQMQVEKKNREPIYRYRTDDQKEHILRFDELWHAKWLSTDGLVGQSPISLARESIGLALATEGYGSKLFSNFAKPGGVLKHPGKLSSDARKNLKESWQTAHSGEAAAHKVAILEEGLEWMQIGFSNEDSQFLETRNFQVEDIARIFRVPSVLIGHPDKNSTYASAEQFFLSFVVHTVRPWLVRIEQSANRALILNEKERNKYFVEFKLEGLLRGDMKSRYDAYAIAIQNRWMSVNEVRALENMNPISGGDKYENPNITPGDKKPAGDNQDGDGKENI